MPATFTESDFSDTATEPLTFSEEDFQSPEPEWQRISPIPLAEQTPLPDQEIGPEGPSGMAIRQRRQIREALSPILGDTPEQAALRLGGIPQRGLIHPKPSFELPRFPDLSGLPNVPAGPLMLNPAIAGAALNTGAGFVEGMANPMAAASLAVGGPLVSGAFAAQAAAGAPEAIDRAYETLKDPRATLQEKAESILGAAGTIGVAVGAGSHALGKARPEALPVTEAPERRLDVAAIPETKAPEAPPEAIPEPTSVSPSETPVAAPEPATTPSEAPMASPDIIGIKNAAIDDQRAARGLPARMDPLRGTFGQWWDDAVAKAEQDPQIGSRLVDELQANPRPLNPEENAQLLHEVAMREEATDRAIEAVNKAETPEAKQEAETRLAAALDDNLKANDVADRVGTLNGQGLAARKMMVDQDFTLARMVAMKRAVSGGAELTPAQMSEVRDLHAKIADLQKQIDSHSAKQAEELGREHFRQLVSEMRSQAAATKKSGGNFVDFMRSQREQARERIRARLQSGKLSANPVGALAGHLADEAIIGASYIAEGVVDFAKWSKKVIEDIGERTPEFLKKLFEDSKSYHDANQKLFRVNVEGGEPKSPEAIAAQIKAGAEGGKPLNKQRVYELARSLINSGVDGFDNVFERVHDIVKESYPGITRRDVHDAFSEYGKIRLPSPEIDRAKLREYRRMAQLVSAIEDVQQGTPPRRTGYQRDQPTQSVRELTAKLEEAIKTSGIEITSPEEQLKSSLQSVKTRLENQIQDLEKQIATGEKPLKRSKIEYDAEANALKAKRDQLKNQLEAINGGARLQQIKASLEARTKALEKKIATGDYTKPIRNEVKLDAEALRLQAEYRKVQQRYQQGLEADRRSRMTRLQKAAASFVRWERAFKLSSPTTLGKLVAAGVTRLATTPIEEAVGGALSKLPVLGQVAAKAPREGGLSISAESKAITDGLIEGGRKSWKILTEGKSEKDFALGKIKLEPFSPAEIPGRIHGALKNPIKEAEYARSLQKRIESGIQNGVDVTDPFVQAKMMKDAYIDANRSIFLQDNFLTDAYTAGINFLEHSKKFPRTGEISARIAQFLIPIVKVPTNIVFETANYAGGTVAGSVRLLLAIRNGLDSLKPEEADAIMRHFKKGALGAGLIALGYFNSENAGGYYQEGEKRKPTDVKPSGFRLFGVDMPRWMFHAPAFEAIQIGATIRRVADKIEKNTGEPKGEMAGVVASAFGLVQEVPFADEAVRIGKTMSESGRRQFFGELAKSTISPALLQDIARRLDVHDWQGEPVKRKPTTILEHVEMGIPGLRENVPLKVENTSDRRGQRNSFSIKPTK